MGKEEQLLERWRELTPEKQQKVFEFVEALKSDSEATPIITEYIPQTPLAKKLWEIRTRALLEYNYSTKQKLNKSFKLKNGWRNFWECLL
jgi:hypothetical protein